MMCAIETAQFSIGCMVRSPFDRPSAGAASAVPDRELMGISATAMADASTVVTMYDPASLQVRADVRLEDVPHVVVGQSGAN